MPERGREDMAKGRIAVFRPYDFQVGQKINIDGGPRNGDWEVVGVTKGKVRLRCPLSGQEVEWARFCYFVEEREGTEWPSEGEG